MEPITVSLSISSSYTISSRLVEDPDSTLIPPLKPLPDRVPPPLPTAEKPGFPNFIDGKVGFKSPRVPWSEEKQGPMPQGFTYKKATKLEELAMNHDPQPGAIFTKIPFPREVPVVKHNVSVIERSIRLNGFGWFVPRGTLFILDEEIPNVHKDTPADYVPFFLRGNIPFGRTNGTLFASYNLSILAPACSE